jgi:PST family polysaccharide transporter
MADSTFVPPLSPTPDASTVSPLSPLAVLRHSYKLSAANLFTALVMFPLNIVIAKVIGPNLLGVAGYVALWVLYANLIKPGVFAAAYREMPPALAAGDVARARQLQNLGITVEAVYLLLPCVVFVIAAVLQPTSVLRIAMLLGVLVLLAGQLQYFVASVQWAHQRFGLIARANFVGGAVGAAFILISLWSLKTYTAVLAPGVVALASAVVYFLLAPPLGFQPSWNRAEFLRLLKIGVPLGLATLCYWGFRTVDRTVVAAGLTLTQLGYFTFAVQFVNVAILFVADFGNVVQPRLFASLSRDEPYALASTMRKLMFSVLVATAAAASLAQAGFGPFVTWLLPAFRPAVPVFEILIFLVACGSAAIIPTFVLSSATLNRQQYTVVVYAAGVLINGTLAVASIVLGFGLIGVAIASVVSQAAISAVLIASIRAQLGQHLLGRYFLTLLAVAVFGALVYAILQVGPLTYGPGISLLARFLLRVGMVALAWGLVVAAVVVIRRTAAASAFGLATR